MSALKSHKGIFIDPRTKLILLFLCVLSVMIAPSLMYELWLVLFIALIGIVSGKWRYSIISAVIYFVIYIITAIVVNMETGIIRTMLIAFFGLLHKTYPCGMLSGIFIFTTKVSEFMSAMNRIHIPKKIIIPLAVMLRYIPTIREDWHFIKDAMRMRDVSPSIKGFFTNPQMNVECIYVPLMMAASKAADELSIASMTRGIENPKKRTCLVTIQFGILDILISLCFLLIFIAGYFM